MAQEYELGLTRNRLFEFNNAVIFCGKYPDDFDQAKLQKTVKALSLKEPVLKSKIELRDEKAFLIFDEELEAFESSNLSADELKRKLKNEGLNFWEALFKIYRTRDNYLLIASHTAVSDAKSLLRLAKSFISIYRDNERIFDESEIFTFPKASDLPADVVSPFTENLSAELDIKWQKYKKAYTVEDYIKARAEFLKNKKSDGVLKATIASKTVDELKSYSKEKNVDLMSIGGFYFFESLLNDVGESKKHNKIVITCDRRFFFNDSDKYGIGAFNGSVETSLSSKEQKLKSEEKLKAFHLNCYKGLTSSFRAFYDDVLLSRLSPSYSDSSYLYLAGVTKNKASKKLSCNYGCGNKKLCSYDFYNLDQAYYEKLKAFESVEVFENFKDRFSFGINIVLFKGEGFVTLKYKPDKADSLKAQKVMNTALTGMENLKK